MLTYTLRRLMFAVPTLFFIAAAIFFLLELAPGDPMANVPLTVPSEVREQMRQALGLGEPAHIRFVLWLKQFFWIEPLNLVDHWFGTTFAEGELRIISWQNRSPVFLTIAERIPQTLWVVGTSYLVAILIAIPIGIYSAYRQYSLFDQAGTFITMIGFSVPPFFSGVFVILIFSVYLGWFPTIYDTRLVVNDWDSFMQQVRQMILPVMVLALQITSQLSRFMRASVLDNLNQDYVRTARAKGLVERRVILVHVLRNSLLPVVTVIALYVPAIFSGAIITEQIFKVNGIGQLLITALQANDWPMVQTLSFIFAVLIVVSNLVADLLYGILDPRIRYD
ncbi:ABC transporter permease [Jannaschia aquimarina]|uniref:DppB protein n=1 Tax=Jannaschia aquimarina TaxID=935700 RepID=A0A0D1CMS5_9RHOB|nr:ABC transporter permease [Jannaschia aquimarina]KIT16097.1 Dipeptide transport system permease protein DppB [Jannaschia aquimarina]SNT02301.1 peptide/nickel transport system permease protein [Jannaschia aquimarina]